MFSVAVCQMKYVTHIIFIYIYICLNYFFQIVSTNYCLSSATVSVNDLSQVWAAQSFYRYVWPRLGFLSLLIPLVLISSLVSSVLTELRNSDFYQANKSSFALGL